MSAARQRTSRRLKRIGRGTAPPPTSRYRVRTPIDRRRATSWAVSRSGGLSGSGRRGGIGSASPVRPSPASGAVSVSAPHYELMYSKATRQELQAKKTSCRERRSTALKGMTAGRGFGPGRAREKGVGPPAFRETQAGPGSLSLGREAAGYFSATKRL